MYKLTLFIPLEFKEKVKEAIFAAGGGRIGNYDSCSFEIVGQGQFRPLAGANPYLGQAGQVERVKEVRLELVIEDCLVKEVLKAMKNAHPYEEVAYDLIELQNNKFI